MPVYPSLTPRRKREMATTFFFPAKTFLPLLFSSPSSSSSSSSSSLITTVTSNCGQKANVKKDLTLCKAVTSENSKNCPTLTKRSFAICLTTTFTFTFVNGYSSNVNAAILEADDDEELLERVKRDRKKRLERQGVINSSNKETVYLQDLVYKLSKVGQAIDKNDLPAASLVLRPSTDVDWIQKANMAFSKLSSSPEEKIEVDTFNSSLASLISSVIRNDVEASKLAFVTSASAFEKWTALTGLLGQLNGL